MKTALNNFNFSLIIKQSGAGVHGTPPMDWSRTLLVSSYLGNGEQKFLKTALDKMNSGVVTQNHKGRCKGFERIVKM